LKHHLQKFRAVLKHHHRNLHQPHLKRSTLGNILTTEPLQEVPDFMDATLHRLLTLSLLGNHAEIVVPLMTHAADFGGLMQPTKDVIDKVEVT
jgi:hypothetical protein